MDRFAPWLLFAAILGCGSESEPESPAEPTLSVVRHESCLPAEVEGAEVLEGPQLTAETADRDEIRANLGEGDAIVRIHAILYGGDEAQLERETEQGMLTGCEQDPRCEEQRIDGQRARRVAVGIPGLESTALFVEPGIRVSVLAPAGRSVAFAELIDFDCLGRLHAERHGD